MKKLNIKTLTKQDLGKALIYTGKLLISQKLNNATVKVVRVHLSKFLNKLSRQRKDLDIQIMGGDETSAFDLADKNIRYNYLVNGRAFFISGYHLLHPEDKSITEMDLVVHPTRPNVISLVFDSKTTLVGKTDYRKIVKAVKSGKKYADVMDDYDDKEMTKIDENTPDFNPDYDEMADASEGAQMDSVSIEDFASVKFADKFGKSKAEKNKLFLQGLILNNQQDNVFL